MEAVQVSSAVSPVSPLPSLIVPCVPCRRGRRDVISVWVMPSGEG